MAHNDAALTRAAVTIPLTDAAGNKRDIKIRALSDRQVVELDDWIRSKIMRIAMSAIAPTTPAAMQTLLIDRALAASLKAGFLSREGVEYFNTIEGIQQLIFCSQCEDSAMPIEDIRALLCVELLANVKIASAMYKTCNSVGDSAAAGADEKKAITTTIAE